MRRGASSAAVALLGSLVVAGCGSSPGTPHVASGSTHRPATGHAPSTPAAAAADLVVRRVATLPHGLSRTVAVAQPDGSVLLLGGLVAGDVTTASILRFDPVSGATAAAGRLALGVHDAAGLRVGGQTLVFGGGGGGRGDEVQTVSAGASTVTARLAGARSDSAAAMVGGTAYVLGGFDGSGLVRRVEATGDGRSMRVAGTLAQGVRYPAVAAAGGAIWIVGGQLATTEGTLGGGQTNDIQRFDPVSGRTTVVGHLPVTLGHAVGFSLGGAVYVAGGRVGTAASRTIWRLDPATGRVRAVGRLPVACSDLAAVVEGGTAWLFGGETSGPLAPIRDVFRVTVG